MVVGLIVAATGVTPDHWRASAVHNLHIPPDALHLWTAGFDLRWMLLGAGILLVSARNSSFTYKGRAVDVKHVGHELGVRHILEGSVRRARGAYPLWTGLLPTGRPAEGRAALEDELRLNPRDESATLNRAQLAMSHCFERNCGAAPRKATVFAPRSHQAFRAARPPWVREADYAHAIEGLHQAAAGTA